MSRPKLFLCLLASLALALPAVGIPLISGAAAKTHHKKKKKKPGKKPSCHVTASAESVGSTVSGEGGVPTYSLSIDCTGTGPDHLLGADFTKFSVKSNKPVQKPSGFRPAEPTSLNGHCKKTSTQSFSCSVPHGGGDESRHAGAGFTSTVRCQDNGGWKGTVTIPKITTSNNVPVKMTKKFKGTCYVNGSPV
jgi:hypothetical protein